MPLDTQNGEYDQRTKEAYVDAIYDELRAQLDEEPEDIEDAVLHSYVESIATVLAENQEQGLDDVHDAAFVESAAGADLEALVEPLTIDRRDGRRATGVQRFIAQSRVTADVTIPDGTTVSTSNGTVSFETTESGEISLYDSFERTSPLDEYTGDTGAWNTQTTFATEGSTGLESPDGTTGTIIKTGSTFVRGSDLHADVQLVSGGAGPDAIKLLYLADSTSSWYGVEVDASNNLLGIWSTAAREVSVSPTIPPDTELHVELTTTTDGEHTATLYDSNGEIDSVTWNESNPDRYEGHIGLDGNNGRAFVDYIGQTYTLLDSRAITAGSDGNVGAGNLTVMSNPPAGVNTTTNPIATGNPDVVDTSGTPLVSGAGEESDERLRGRTLENAPERQHPILRELAQLQSVTSLGIETNTTDTADADNRPAKSFEVIVPNDANFIEVGQTIFDAKAFTSNDVGGYAGTAQSVTATDYLGNEHTVNFSSAATTDVDMTLAIVVDADEYDGDAALRRRVVEYIGGTRADGSSAIGTDIGEDVRVDQIREAVQDDSGVLGFDDANTSFTPATSTNANGLTVISIASTNIAECDATDGSITINKTQV